MKKSEKNSSTGRTICTRSLGTPALVSIEHQNHGLRRPNRGTPSKNPITPATTTRKSERLASPPASVTIKSGRMEKKNAPSPLRSSDNRKNVASQSSKGSDHSNRKTDTSSDIEQRKDKKENIVQESTDKIKKREPKMSALSDRALFRGKLKKAEELVNTSSNDEELVVVGCSHRIPASNDDARDSNTECPPSANSEPKRLPGGETSLKKGTVFPSKSGRDTENMVPNATPMVETGDDSVIGSPFENKETQMRLVSKTSLETDIELPLKRERNTAEIVLDACPIVANGDDRNFSADWVILSPPGCENDNQRETCSTCVKRQKVNGDSQYLSICSCTSQPVEESDHMAQDIKETGVATSRDNEKNRQIQHDKSLHLSIYPEYWVPVQLSDVQLEQYCRTLFSKSLSLSSLSKYNLGALEESLHSIRKTCDHPYVMDASLKQLLTKNLQLHEILDVEVKASGKLHLLDAMLTQIQKTGLKAVVFYQATQSPEGLLLGNILEDFVSQRFGQKSYEHGIYAAKKNAINNFNKENECCVLLLETRACSQTIKLLRAEVFIIFGSSLNPSCDVKLLQKIKIESYSERTKIFRLYSVCTVEEKALIMARQNKWQNRRGDKPLEGLNRSLMHALLMWGATYLFDKLDCFHGIATPDSGLPFEQCVMDSVIHEFSSILSSKGGEENEGKLCLILEAKHVQGTYSTDSTLFGEKHIKFSDEDSPNTFWTKLVRGRNPTWKYTSDTPQRNRKRVQYFEGSEKSPKIADGGNTKKRKKASDDVTDLPVTDPPVTASPVDNVEKKASGRDNIGAMESPKVKALQSSCKSTSVTSGTSLDGNNAFGLYSMGGHISGIPEDMLAGHDWRQIPRYSQRRLHAVLKSEMAKLGNVLQLSDDWTRMVEKFLEYVIENHRICEEPATILQAFQMALSWIAALLVKQKLNHKESLACAKSELAFECSRQEVDYIYSIMYCMKSVFLEHVRGLQLDCLSTSSKQAMVSTKQVNESLSGTTVGQEKNSMKSMHRLEGVECMTEKRGSRYSTTTKDIEKTISDIKRKCKKKVQNLVQKHEEEKLELVGKYVDKKRELESTKRVEEAVIRIACSGTSTQSLVDDLKRLNHDSDRRFNKIASEKDKSLKNLEQMHEAKKKKLAEDEACWINRIENWAQAVLKNRAPIKSGNNKHSSGICLSNTSENAPDILTYNDANGEATYADTNCMVSKENQMSEAQNTLGTVLGVSTRQVHELVGSRNDKAMDVSTLVSEQPTDGVPTKSQSNEHASITVPDNLVAAGCHEKFAALNVHVSEYQNCDKSTSATPDEDVSSRVPEMSQSISNLAKSASRQFSLIGEEALVTVKDNRTSHMGSDASNILDQQNEDTCSLEREKPDELALPMPHPESVVATRGSAGTDQDDKDICPMPSSLAGKQSETAANIQGQNIEAPIEPQSAGSEIVQTADIAGSGIVETTDCAASNEDDLVTGPLPLSPAGNEPVPEANIEGQNINTSAEPHVAGADAVESGDNGAIDPETMVVQDACSLPSALVGTQSDLGANIEGQNMTAVAQLPTGGSDAVEAGGSPVSDQATMIAQDACSLPSALVGTQSDLGANAEGQNMTAVAQLPTDGSDAVEAGGSHVSDQDAQDASPLPLSSPENHLDSVVNVEGLNNTTVAEPHTTGSDACEMETAEPGLQVERPTFANIVHEAGVEPSAGVTAPVPSLLNNGTGQSAVQLVPQIPFPVFNDPHLHELEKLRRESENSMKTFEEKKSILIAELERRMAEVQAEFRRIFNEVEAEHKTRTTEIETSKNFIIMNKLLANAFLSKCTEKKAAPRGRTQQLVQRATQVSALRNSSHASAPLLEAPSFPAPTPLQPQTPLFPSSGSRPSGLPLNTGVYPMPQPRQPLISNVAPTPSASPATNPVVNAGIRAPAPHLNSYRPSSSPPVAMATQTSSRPPPQALKYSAVSIQQQQQVQPQQNLSSGFQGNYGVVCLSDDE